MTELDQRTEFRLVVELQVEVTDVLVLRERALDISSDANGVGNDALSTLVGWLVTDAIRAGAEISGFTVRGSSTLPRHYGADGEYPKLILASMPNRAITEGWVPTDD